MSGLRDFKKVAGTPEVSKLQERLQEFFKPLVDNPLLDGLLLGEIEIATTPTLVEHKLRRAPLGWIIVSKNANADVWQTTQTLQAAHLTLQASAPVTVTLWVF